MTQRETFYKELGHYFRAAGLHPADLVRRWSAIERFVDRKRREGASVREVALTLGLIEDKANGNT